MLNPFQKRPSGFFWGMIAGSLVGAMSALLLAPKSGRELRREIAYGAHQAGETAARFTEQAREQTERLVRRVGAQTNELADRTKHAAGEVIRDMRGWRSSRHADGATAAPGPGDMEAAEMMSPLESSDSIQAADIRELELERMLEEIDKS